eukprot:2120343-Rhodomonas_salina.5
MQIVVDDRIRVEMGNCAIRSGYSAQLLEYVAKNVGLRWARDSSYSYGFAVRCAVLRCPKLLRLVCAVSGTDVGYAATRRVRARDQPRHPSRCLPTCVLRDARPTRCAVLRERRERADAVLRDARLEAHYLLHPR